MTTHGNCPLCDSQADFRRTDEDWELVTCPICQQYFVTSNYLNDLSLSDLQESRHRLSAFFLEISYRYSTKDTRMKQLNQFKLNADFQTNILAKNPLIPDEFDTDTKILKLLRYVRQKTHHPGQTIQIKHQLLAPLLYSRNDDELKFLWQIIESKSLIDGLQIKIGAQGAFSFSGSGIILTAEALNFLDGKDSKSNQIFVAMKFSEEMLSIFDDAFKREIKAQTGFDLKLISDKEHNNLIEDEIIAEIRRSVALIADFSDNNYGAYYEAGYAHASGKELIFICNKEKFDSQDESVKPHFDVNHRNFIVWKDKGDLRKKLIKRIEATL